jgi:hypothetical protein
MNPATAATAETTNDSDRLAYTLNEFCRAAPCSRTTAYAEIRAGRLQAKKLGSRTIIPLDVARSFIAGLPNVKAAA